jgi:hypothetical protein
MKTTHLLFTSFALLSLLVSSPPLLTQNAEPSSPIGLQVRHLSFNPQSRVVTFDLFNATEKQINSWSLLVTTKYVDGAESSSVFDEDVSQASGIEDGVIKAGAHRNIVPGNFYHSECLADKRVDNTAISGVEISVKAVIFTDGDYDGDAIQINQIFDDRKARSQELGVFLDSLRQAKNSPDRTQALRDLLKSHESKEPVSSMANGRARRTAETERREIGSWLRAFLEQIDSKGQNPDLVFSKLLEFVQVLSNESSKYSRMRAR